MGFMDKARETAAGGKKTDKGKDSQKKKVKEPSVSAKRTVRSQSSASPSPAQPSVAEEQEKKVAADPQLTQAAAADPAVQQAIEQPSADSASIPFAKKKEKTPEEKAEEERMRQEQERVRSELGKLTQGQDITLRIDTVVDTLKKAPNQAMTIKQISKAAQLPANVVEYYCRILAKQKIVSLKYPLNPLSSPRITYLDPDREKEHALDIDGDKKLIEHYTVTADNVTADINVWSVPFENTAVYEVVHHHLSQASEALLADLVMKLADYLEVDAEDSEQDYVDKKKKYMKAAKQVVRDNVDNIEEGMVSILAGELFHRTFGLGDLEVIMADNWLEEIAVNGPDEPLSLYHKRYGWLKTTKFFSKESEIYNLASLIGRKVGKQINALNPIMDAHLETGDRVAATLFPVSTSGDTLTIRRFSRNPWTVVHMVDPKNHTMSTDLMSFLWMAVQYELNILVVGGTASGKTSALNTLGSLIPPSNRIITIEDTREISLPHALHWNWVPLASKSANTEGQGEVTMLDLMVASLRMRPDRIIVGEIRRKAQAESLFEAMHTGHSVAATMHADTAEQVKRRLTQPPIDIPENELQALQLVTVQYRDRRRGIRRTLEVAELLPGAADEKINLNYLFRWRPRRDKFVQDEPSVRVIEDMNLHTGMTQREVEEDLQQKSDILNWMVNNKITDVDKVGQIMRIYYKYPKLLLDTIADKSGSSAVLGNVDLQENA
ncbi:MAG: type II/IV secretion system ATPase subunit [Nanoarchaeota archaeon]